MASVTASDTVTEHDYATLLLMNANEHSGIIARIPLATRQMRRSEPTSSRFQACTSPIPASNRGQDTVADVQNDFTIRASQYSQVASTLRETTTVYSESSQKNVTPHHLEVIRYTATSSGNEVQDKLDGGDGMDRRAKEHVGVSGLRRDSLYESMADEERASICNGPRRDSASHMTGDSDDEWRMASERTSIGAFNLDRANTDTDQPPGMDTEDDGHSLISPGPTAAAFSTPQQDMNPDGDQHYALRPRPSTSDRYTTKKTSAGSSKKRKSPVKQLRSNAKQAKILECNANFAVIPNSLLPLSDCLVQPAEIHAKISKRLNTHNTDLTLMLTRLFYAFGSPESFYQLHRYQAPHLSISHASTLEVVH